MDKISAGYLLLELEPIRVSPLIVEEITTQRHMFSVTWVPGMVVWTWRIKKKDDQTILVANIDPYTFVPLNSQPHHQFTDLDLGIIGSINIVLNGENINNWIINLRG